MDDHDEILFGGAAGPGKSYGLLMAALQYVRFPGYHALILRRTFPQLTQPDGLMMMADEWLGGTDAKYNSQDHRWAFPSGATLTFGHCQYERDKYNYQGGGYRFIGFDELTQFTESMYKYIAFSRRRRTLDMTHIPLRVVSTSNPGGIGHEWVKTRLVDIETRADRATFIPALLSDNLLMDSESYTESLMELDPVTMEQLLNGDWSVRPRGAIFQREWFEIVEAAPAQASRVRYWDEAATAAEPGKHPDYTAGARLAWADGVLYIEDVQHAQLDPLGVDKRIRQTAELDGYEIPIWSEQEPGASGKQRIAHIRSIVLPDFTYDGITSTGSKVVRAGPVASQAKAGNVKLVRGAWNKPFLDEAETFGLPGFNDDIIDSVSGGYHRLIAAREYAYAF